MSAIPETIWPPYCDGNQKESQTLKAIDEAPETKPNPTWITAKDISALKQLPYLTGLRAIASIFIQILHMSKPGSKYIDYFAVFSLTTHWVQGAFLITGYLLGLQAKPKSTKRWYSIYEHLPNFFISRIVRLYPALIAVLALNSIWWLNRYHDPIHLAKIVIRAFFKICQQQTFLPVPKKPHNPFGHIWFLVVQEHFYVFWGLVLPIVVKFKSFGRLVCLAAIFAFSYRRRLQVGHYNASLLLNLYKLIFGAAIYLFPIHRGSLLRYANTAAVAVIAITCIWGLSPTLQNNYTVLEQRTHAENFSVLSTVMLTLAAIAKGLKESDQGYQNERKLYLAKREEENAGQVWYIVYYRNLQDWDILNILDSKGLAFIGRISYSWYLWQFPLMAWDKSFRKGMFHESLGTTCLAFICAMVSTFYFEEPVKNAYLAYRKRNSLASRTISPAKPKIRPEYHYAAASNDTVTVDHHISLHLY